MNEFVTQLSDIESVDSRIGSAMSCTFDKLSLSHSLSSSGFLTENSSLFSMTENDFDQLATKKTSELFDAMDGILFDGKHDGNHAIIRECHEWRSAFPHLRVTGTKLLEQQEHGYQRYSPSTKLMNNELTYRHLRGKETFPLTDFFNSMSLEVKGEKASKILKSVGSGEEDEADEYGSSINGANYDVDDEVIEHQGHYEEVLAIDYYSSEERKRGPRHNNSGLPPVTPVNCWRDQLLSNLCLNIFQTFSPVLTTLLFKFVEQHSKVFTSEKAATKTSHDLADRKTTHHLPFNPITPKNNPSHDFKNLYEHELVHVDDLETDRQQCDVASQRSSSQRNILQNGLHNVMSSPEKSSLLSTVFPYVDDINLDGVLTVRPLFTDREAETTSVLSSKRSHSSYKQQADDGLHDLIYDTSTTNKHHQISPRQIHSLSFKPQLSNDTSKQPQSFHQHQQPHQQQHQQQHHHHAISHLLSVPEEPRSGNQPAPTSTSNALHRPSNNPAGQHPHKNVLPHLRNKPHTAVPSNNTHHSQQRSYSKLVGQATTKNAVLENKKGKPGDNLHKKCVTFETNASNLFTVRKTDNKSEKFKDKLNCCKRKNDVSSSSKAVSTIESPENNLNEISGASTKSTTFASPLNSPSTSILPPALHIETLSDDQLVPLINRILKVGLIDQQPRNDHVKFGFNDSSLCSTNIVDNNGCITNESCQFTGFKKEINKNNVKTHKQVVKSSDFIKKFSNKNCYQMNSLILDNNNSCAFNKRHKNNNSDEQTYNWDVPNMYCFNHKTRKLYHPVKQMDTNVIPASVVASNKNMKFLCETTINNTLDIKHANLTNINNNLHRDLFKSSNATDTFDNINISLHHLTCESIDVSKGLRLMCNHLNEVCSCIENFCHELQTLYDH